MTLPEATTSWDVRLSDPDTGNVLFESRIKSGGFLSAKRFFVRFGIEVRQDGRLVFEHALDLRDREVLVQFPVGALGDILAWFPYAAEQALADTFYATYSMGMFFDDVDCNWQPTDFRAVGRHRTAAYILGVDPGERKPLLALPDESPPIAEPYGCIAVQASSQSKYWNNPTGWRDVIAFLKRRGLRVICIDQKPVHGTGLVWNHVPHGAEDEAGDRPLGERARWLRHASDFLGLSSGLAWRACAAGCPVLMVSGFTHPTNEFDTSFRVINWHTCNSCWNDIRHRFDHKDFLWCPRHADTPCQFECTRLITAEHVIDVLNTMPLLSGASGVASAQASP